MELFDWDAIGAHDFLGGVELDVGEVAELQRATLAKAMRISGGNEGDKVWVGFSCRPIMVDQNHSNDIYIYM